MASGAASSHGVDRNMPPVSVATPARTGADPLPTFHDLLDALNPLQYLPVIGTIYRVVTGDQGSPGVRTAVSMVSGLLMGGPFGLLTSMAGDLFERLVHPEAAMHTLLAGASPATRAAEPAPVAIPAAPPASVSQALAAYGATQRLAAVAR